MGKDEYSQYNLYTPQFSTDLHNIIVALSDAVDCLCDSNTQHSKRVAMIAIRCAERLDWNRKDRYRLFELALLHDIGQRNLCGISQLSEKTHLGLSNRNCILGHQLLSEFAPLAHLAMPILYLNNSWQELQDTPLNDTHKLSTNLIQLADFIDINVSRYPPEQLLSHVNEITAKVSELSGSCFSPQLVTIVTELAQEHSFWLSFHPHVVNFFVHDFSPAEQNLTLTIEELKELALLFSQLVDTQSSFTAEHSACVGLIARYLAELKGLPLITCQKLEIAGYLHDLGTLRIDPLIINKKGRFNAQEQALIETHVQHTQEILGGIVGIEDICQWISFHHERLDGSGYPYHPKAEYISTEARILAVADVFQALSQERPHRKAFARLEIIRELNIMTRSNKLDKELVSLLCQHFTTFYQLATQLAHPPIWWQHHHNHRKRLSPR